MFCTNYTPSNTTTGLLSASATINADRRKLQEPSTLQGVLLGYACVLYVHEARSLTIALRASGCLGQSLKR